MMFVNDSRRAAVRLYRTLRYGWIYYTSTFLGNLVLALLATWLFRQWGYGDPVDYVFFVSILAVGLWVTEAIPPFAVGILIVALLLMGFGSDFILDAPAPVEIYLNTWTSNVVWLLLGGFFLALGMKEVQLDSDLFQATIRRFGHQPKELLKGIMLVTALASMVMSNTATTAMMISSILPLVHLLGKDAALSKAILIGVPGAATVGGIGTVIGSTPNAIAVGALHDNGISLNFIEWMIFGVPTALLLTYLFFRFLCRHFPMDDKPLDISGLLITQTPADPTKRRAVILTLILTVGLWLTEPLHGIPVAATSAVPIVLLTLTQVINGEMVRTLPWDTLMLVAGGMALGLALSEVGLTLILMEKIYDLALPILGLAFLFCLIAVNLSNVMSNTAAAAILVPLATTMPGLYGVAGPLLVAICCSLALLLPVSTPSNAVAFSTGYIAQKDFRPGGVFFILVGPPLVLGIVLLWAYGKSLFG